MFKNNQFFKVIHSASLQGREILSHLWVGNWFRAQFTLISWKSDLDSTPVLTFHWTSENSASENCAVLFGFQFCTCSYYSDMLGTQTVTGPGMWEHPVPKDDQGSVRALVPRAPLAPPPGARSPGGWVGRMAVNVRLGPQRFWTPAVGNSGVEAVGHSGKIRFGLTDVKLITQWQSRFLFF